MMLMRLSDFVEVQAGYHSRRTIKFDPNGTHRIIQIRDFDELLNLRADQLVTFSPDGNPERYEVFAGDVLFLSRGTRNFAAVISERLDRTVAPGYFYILRLKTKRVNPDYLAWYLNSPEMQSQLKALQRGTQIPIVPMPEFKLLEVKVPPLDVQRTIVRLDLLMQREKQLCRQITEKRAELVHQMCLHGIKNSTIEREPKHD